MALRFSTTLRNAVADACESTVGTSPILRILTGSEPASCAAAQTGTLLAEMTLPSDWLTAGSSGAKSVSGTWSDTAANGTGTASYFRIYDSSATTCHWQGTVTATGGGGQLELDSTSITTGQLVTITGGSLTTGNT